MAIRMLCRTASILGDPGAVSGGEKKSKTGEKKIRAKKSQRGVQMEVQKGAQKGVRKGIQEGVQNRRESRRGSRRGPNGVPAGFQIEGGPRFVPTRESFLMDLSGTLEPHGMNRRDES